RTLPRPRPSRRGAWGATGRTMPAKSKLLRARQKLGKYRIVGRLSVGPRSAIYKAYDTIHDAHMALKIPHPEMMDDYFLSDFRREAKLATRMEHPNILPI